MAAEMAQGRLFFYKNAGPPQNPEEMLDQSGRVLDSKFIICFAEKILQRIF